MKMFAKIVSARGAFLRRVQAVDGPDSSSCKTEQGIVPGLYRNGRGCDRLVLEVVGGRVVYSFDNGNASVLRLTTCDTRTLDAAGMGLVYPFSAQQVASLKKRCIALRGRCWCSRVEKHLFFGPTRIEGLPEFAWRNRPEVQAPPVVAPVEATPAVAPEQTWRQRVISYLRNVLSILFRRHPASAPSISSVTA